MLQVNPLNQGQWFAAFLSVYRNTALQRHRTAGTIHINKQKTGKTADGSRIMYIGIYFFPPCFSFSFRIASFCCSGQWDAFALFLSPIGVFWAADIYLELWLYSASLSLGCFINALSQHIGEKTVLQVINHAISQGYMDLTISSANEQNKWIYGFRENINTKLKMPAIGINAEETWLILEVLQDWAHLHIFHCLYDNWQQNLSICFGIKDTIIIIKL